MTAVLIPEMRGSYEDALLRSTGRELINVCHLTYSRAVSLNQVHRLQLDERPPPAPLQHAQTRLRSLPAFEHAPARARLLVAAYGRVDCLRVPFDPPAHDREVTLLDEPTVEVLRETTERGLSFGDDQKARRVAVESVHDAGTYEMRIAEFGFFRRGDGGMGRRGERICVVKRLPVSPSALLPVRL